jgi:hypothetical protein
MGSLTEITQKRKKKGTNGFKEQFHDTFFIKIE